MEVLPPGLLLSGDWGLPMGVGHQHQQKQKQKQKEKQNQRLLRRQYQPVNR